MKCVHNDPQFYRYEACRERKLEHLKRVWCKVCGRFVGYYNPEWEKMTKAERRRMGFGKGVGQ